MRIFITTLLMILVFSMISYSSNRTNEYKNWPILKGQYLGQKTPGIIPEIFAPGIISTEEREGCSGWGKKMEYFIFQRSVKRKSKLYIVFKSNDVWLKPEPIKDINKYRVGDFTITSDGKRMVFASKIIIKEIGQRGEGANIWSVNFNKNVWSTPMSFDSKINTIHHDSYPSLSSNQNMYFFSRKPGGFGASDIYMSEFIDGKYQKSINLGEDINTKYDEWDAYIAPDETYIIYCSTMPGGLGQDDLYISFRQKSGVWSKPIHMGSIINTSGSENRPYVSPDGKYLFYAAVKEGNRDIYWVSTKIIKSLNK